MVKVILQKLLRALKISIEIEIIPVVSFQALGIRDPRVEN